ncbi:glycoside hydrolase family 113 [Marivirga sericea]|uniref:glycoside hydrolase family 113 n=1 Tax=Marivirga sericea TaxID=1028 RepID=UPI00111C897F|nr:hypothetical protein [Marivirga sericea]
MNKRNFTIGFIILIIIVAFSGSIFFPDSRTAKPEKIKGFNLVAPPQVFPLDSLQKVKEVGASWVAIVPYAFCNAQTGEITFDHQRQWWGEKPTGVKETIIMAKSLGFRIMLKPHLWVGGQGWAGDLEFESDSLWEVFEEQYTAYISTYAKIADSLNVEIYCLGTEIRKSTGSRNDFWIELISKSRSTYSGKLTYAANWDEYDQIEFWNQLDYIGIDAYFPLSEKKSPTTQELIKAWLEPKKEMKKISEKYHRPILFTEYGYESIDYNTMGHWKLSKDSLSVNFDNQKIAFRALYQTLNQEDWWVGGFIWKWHLTRNGLHRRTVKAFTPQNKPAIETITSAFKHTF